MGGGKGGGGQSQEVRLDPQTRSFIENRLRPAAVNAANVAQFNDDPFFSGATQEQRQAAGNLAGLQQNQLGTLFGGAGQAIQNLGFAGTRGIDPQTLASFSNPFEQQVISGVQGDFDRQRQLASQQANQQATQAGAFGGSRSAILQAEALNNVNRNEASTLANLRSGNFNNAIANQLRQQGLASNLGLGGLQAFGRGIGLGGGLAGQQFGMGETFRGIENQRDQEGIFRNQQALGFLGQGIGAYGQNSLASNNASPLGSAASGALAGSAFGPWGAAIGGGVGLLGGIFG